MKILYTLMILDQNVYRSPHLNKNYNHVTRHQNHYKIFKTHFPISMRNWHLDDWASNVYGPKRTVRVEGMFIRNTNAFGTRYDVCHEDKQILQRELEDGSQRIAHFLGNQSP
mgnify:CR=1 FL=1